MPRTPPYAPVGVRRILHVDTDAPVGASYRRDAPRRRYVLHVDLDAFYASVEVREDPSLAGKPLVIGADPKEGRGRGVVTTASYEARKFGIRSAMPISQAYRLCPDAVYRWPRFELYGAVSENVFAILRATGATVEGASIDEAYLDATAVAKDLPEAEALARRIQDDIVAQERITASVGVASNKLVAKIATDMNKPAGVTVVPEGGEDAFLAPLPARRIPGVGPKTDEALQAMGVRTCAELARVPPAVLAERFGSWGPRLAELARGVDATPVEAEWARKSVGHESTFEVDVSDRAVLERTVDELATEAAVGLADERLAARTLTLKVRFADFRTFTRARTLARPTDDAPTFRAVARELLAESVPEGQPIRLLGVRLGHLVDTLRKQTTLDLWPADLLGEMEPPPDRSLASWVARHGEAPSGGPGSTDARSSKRRWF